MPFGGSSTRSGRSALYAVVPIGLAAGLVLIAGAQAQPTHAGLDDTASTGTSAEASAKTDEHRTVDAETASGSEQARGTGADAARTDVLDDGALRVATSHISLEGSSAADVQATLVGGEEPEAQDLAALVQQVRPDVLVLTGVPYDESHRLADTLNSDYFSDGDARAADGHEGFAYPHMYTAPTNSGVDSGADLDGDGFIGGDGDSLGRGDYPGHYGMIVFSQAPIDADEARTFQDFLWDDLPENSMSEELSEVERAVLPLFGSTLWDLPVSIGEDTVHVIAAARTTFGFVEADPALLHDQRRLIDDYLSEDPADGAYIYDDEEDSGGLGSQRWIFAGDDGLGSGTIRSHTGLDEDDSGRAAGAETSLIWSDLGLD